MGRELYLDGRPVRLGMRIGKGGEGEVYALADDSNLAAKIYTVADGASREAKIATMIRASLSKQAPLVAFPVAILRASDGRFAGFLMPKVGGYRPLHDLYSPGSRKHKFPRADYRFLARTANNIARAVASVHASGCVIGDINHSGILISEKAVAALIDADSFQISEGNQRFYCKVGVPEYTPPELQGQSLAQVVRTANHDAFGLAVVIFQLLFMGRHPFVGAVRKGEVPPLHEAIRDFRFVYTEHRDVGMDQPPGTPVLSDFSTAIAESFEKAFSRETLDRRPSAQEWVRSLELFEQSLIRCDDNTLHHYPSDAADCPWCEMENRLGTVLFVPYVAADASDIHPFDPGAQGFNLDGVIRQIQSVVCITRAQLHPRVKPTEASASSEAISASAAADDSIRTMLRIAACAGGFACAVGATELWIVWVPLLWFAFFGGKTEKRADTEAFAQRYIEVERRWAAALSDWHRRCGIDELEALQKALDVCTREYKQLASQEKQKVDAYLASRRSRQLHTFLDDFEISDAKIKGIGPAKEATLKSYGIETAADVDSTRLLGVPGFGPVNSQSLLAWRQKLEARFVFRERLDDADRQEIARIRSSIADGAATLRRTLIAGPKNLASLSARVAAAAQSPDPLLTRVQLERDRATADLKLLRISAPPLPPFPPASPVGTQPSSRQPSPQQLPTGSSPTTSASVPHCPRCNSRMVQRTARRGRRRGSSFWGCSRYPQCKGTRNT